MSDWTNEVTLKFLKLYRSEHVILWDPIHTHHRNKNKINEAWGRLSAQLQCSVPDLKKKKDSLMATFRRHLRKKKESIKSAARVTDIYKPLWFAYEYMEAFLATPFYECNTTTNTQDTIESFVSGSAWGETSRAVVTRDRENLATENAKVLAPPNLMPPPPAKHMPSTFSQSIETPTIRRRGNPPELREAENQMKEAFNTLRNVLTKRPASDKKEDEYDLFGKMLVKKIKRLQECEREEFMHEIDGMYIKILRRGNPAPTAAYSYTLSTDSFDAPLSSVLTPKYEKRLSSNLSSFSKSKFVTNSSNLYQQHLNKNPSVHQINLPMTSQEKEHIMTKAFSMAVGHNNYN